MIDDILRGALKGGNKAMAAEVTEVVAKQQARQQALKIGPRVPKHIFEVDKVSDNFSEFLNKPIRRNDDKIYPKEAGAKYLQEAKDYWDIHRTFAGFKRYIDPDTGVATHRIKDNSTFLKSGQRAAKPKRLDNDLIERERRLSWEREQTLGPTGRDEFVHHKTPLGFIDRVAAGLNAADRREFYEYVHGSERWPSLKVGNEAENLVGKVGDEAFHPVHVQVHELIKMAGLDGDKIDFTGATMAQRFDFLDEVAPILDQIDEYIFNQRMADQFADQRVMGPAMKGQKQAGERLYEPFTQTY